MGHVQIRCTNCGKTASLPADAHADALLCHGCGAKLTRAHIPKVSGRLRLKEVPRTAPAEASPGKRPAKRRQREAATEILSQPDIIKAAREDAARRLSKPRLRWSGALGGWVLFIALGSICGLARYAGLLSREYLEYIPRVGPLALLALHLLILLKAFSDSIFQGVLCLLVPFYSLYYLLAVSDDFVLRGIVAGLLVGIGQDSAIVLQKYANETIVAVNAWIASGG
ncbi:MAG: hypothetical protein FJ225_01790 [Lentisphaerae bacterium]|nr:hypothetical protein [Lentisphaerota bacterium]